MKNLVFVILGYISVFVGIIGIFLPILPTTIFLIIGSYFFMKGSPKLNKKLLSNKYLGPYIKNYRENRGMPLKSKITSITMIWLSILATIIFFLDNIYLQILLLIVAISVSTYIYSLNTLES